MMDRWLLPLRTSPNPRLSIVGFHYAGGSAQVFSKWTKYLPPDCDLWAAQLPGRWERIGDPFALRIDDVVTPLTQCIQEKIPGRFCFIGYSLGGLVAYEIAQRLRSLGGRQPLHLLVLSRGAPHIQSGPGISQLPDHQFLKEMRSKYGGVPSWLLNDPEMLAVFLPIMRADMTLLESYQPATGTVRLQIPVTAWGGKVDDALPLESLKRWEETTDGPFSCSQLEGGHFFAESHPVSFFKELNSLLIKC